MGQLCHGRHINQDGNEEASMAIALQTVRLRSVVKGMLRYVRRMVFRHSSYYSEDGGYGGDRRKNGAGG